MEFDKSKVYTALNATEDLIGAKGYFADTLIILKECVVNEGQEYQNCEYGSVYSVTTNTIDDYNFFYLVEPPEKWFVVKNADGKLFGINKAIDTCELIKSFSTQKECENYIRLYNAEHSKPKFRPFKNCDELINEYCKKISRTQLNWLDCQPTELPTIWVKPKHKKQIFMITYFSNNGVCLNGSFIEFNRLYDEYTFLDGSVCGVEE